MGPLGQLPWKVMGHKSEGLHEYSGIFFGCLRGRYKAPVPMSNAYIFSQFEQKNSQSEGHFYVNQYSLQIAFIFNGLSIKIKHMIRNKSDSMQFKRPCLREYYKNE